MKLKKFASAVMAGVMALTLTAPAFASSGKVDVAGSINLPTINVVLPTTASMVLNPYGLSVKLNPKDTTETPSTDTVLSPTMYVKNLSNIGIQVKATVAGTVGKGSNAQFLTAKPGSTDKDKGAWVYVKFNIQDDATTAIEKPATDPTLSGSSATHGTALVSVIATGSDPTEVNGFGLDAAASTAAATINQLAPTATKDPAAGGVLAFRFFGEAVQSPEKTEGTDSVLDPWTDKDVLSASIAFTFEVVPGAIVTD